MKVKVNLKKLERDDNTKAVADLTIEDVVIKGVFVKEMQGEKGTYLNFNMPARKYQTEQGDQYKSEVEIKGKDEPTTKAIVKGVRDAITEAYNQTEANEYGRFTSEKDINVDYNKQNIQAYVNQAESDKNPNLRGFATVYLGGVLKLNDITVTEGQNRENGQSFVGITFPSRAREIDGEKKYEEVVFPITPGLRKEMASKVENAYVSSMENTQSQEAEPIEPKNEQDEESEEDSI